MIVKIEALHLLRRSWRSAFMKVSYASDTQWFTSEASDAWWPIYVLSSDVYSP